MLGVLYNEIFLGLNTLESFHIISVAFSLGIITWLLGDKTLNVPSALILIFGLYDVIVLINDGKISGLVVRSSNQNFHVSNRALVL